MPQCFRHGTCVQRVCPPLIFVSVVAVLIGRYAPHSETPDTAAPTSEEQPADKQPKSVTITALFFLLQFFWFQSQFFSFSAIPVSQLRLSLSGGDFEHNGEEH